MIDRKKAPAVSLVGGLQLPKPSEQILANGIKVYRLGGERLAITQLNIVWQGGMLEAIGQHNPGACGKSPSIARIACGLMREGTEHMDADALSEFIDYNGAMLQISAEQHTTMLSLKALNSKFSDLMPVVRDIISKPLMPADKFLRLRDIAVQDFRLMMSKVMFRSTLALAELLKGKDHPELCLDSEQQIQAVTLEDVVKYHQSIFTTDKCCAYISGNVSDDVYDTIVSMLESLPYTNPAPDLYLLPYQPLPPQTVVKTMPGQIQAAVSMGCPAPMREDSDYIPLRFTVIGLGGYFGSRLQKNIREDKGYTYGINSYLLGTREGSDIYIAAQTDPKYISDLIREVGNELKDMVNRPFGKEELQRLRQYIALTLMGYLDSSMAVMDYYRTMHTLKMPTDYFDKQVEWLHHLTPDIVCSMSEKYLNIDKMFISIAK